MFSQVGESVPLLLILMILIPLLVLDQSLTITGQETDPRSFISNVTGLTSIALEITASKANNSLSVAQYWKNHSPDYPSWAWAVV
ncbi:hypothetical protein CRYUN_Cryun26dG0088600 [Craigia yunnanensis]